MSSNGLASPITPPSQLDVDERAYIDAAIPEPFTILGLRLRPLSIGHLILLHRLESPFVVSSAPGATISIGDLALACLVCSKDWLGGLALLEQEDLAKALFKWGLRATRQHGWRILCPWLYTPLKLEEKLELFQEYLKFNMEAPCYSVEESKSRSINCPGWQVVKVVLMSKTTLTEREILDRPYRLCIADFLTLRAMEGQLNFEDESELEQAQELANQLAQKLSERKDNGS
jgi:hypothetical protein